MRPGWAAIGALGISNTAGYGVLFYSYGVLLPLLSAELGHGTTALMTAVVVAQLTQAAAAIPIGRWLDRRGGRGLMITGSVLGVIAVLLWSRIENLASLYFVFILIGLSWAMALYEPTFTVFTQRLPAARRANAILAVTIIAGFASTVFLPLTGKLSAEHGWRGTLLILAAVLLVVMVPLNAAAVPSGVAHTVKTDKADHADIVRAARRDPGFWLIVAGFMSHYLVVGGMSLLLVTMLLAFGHPLGFAATAAGLLGALSVTGRIITTGARRHFDTAAVTATVCVLQAGSLLALSLTGHTRLGAILCVIGYGLGFGLGAVARPAILAERYGTAAYGTIAGSLTAPTIIVSAAAPITAAAVGTAIGYETVLVTLASSQLAAAICLFAVSRRPTVVWPSPGSGDLVPATPTPPLR